MIGRNALLGLGISALVALLPAVLRAQDAGIPDPASLGINLPAVEGAPPETAGLDGFVAVARDGRLLGKPLGSGGAVRELRDVLAVGEFLRGVAAARTRPGQLAPEAGLLVAVDRDCSWETLSRVLLNPCLILGLWKLSFAVQSGRGLQEVKSYLREEDPAEAAAAASAGRRTIRVTVAARPDSAYGFSIGRKSFESADQLVIGLDTLRAAIPGLSAVMNVQTSAPSEPVLRALSAVRRGGLRRVEFAAGFKYPDDAPLEGVRAGPADATPSPASAPDPAAGSVARPPSSAQPSGSASTAAAGEAPAPASPSGAALGAAPPAAGPTAPPDRPAAATPPKPASAGGPIASAGTPAAGSSASGASPSGASAGAAASSSRPPESQPATPPDRATAQPDRPTTTPVRPVPPPERATASPDRSTQQPADRPSAPSDPTPERPAAQPAVQVPPIDPPMKPPLRPIPDRPAPPVGSVHAEQPAVQPGPNRGPGVERTSQPPPVAAGRLEPRLDGRIEGKRRLVTRAGGNDLTENAVLAGLRWLARHQSRDGHWTGVDFDQQCKGALCAGKGYAYYDVGLTGLSVLAFLGAGHTHTSRDTYLDTQTGKTVVMGEIVKGGLRWLIDQQDEMGCVGSKSSLKYIYNHAIACMALAEAYGMTRSDLFRAPAQKAIDFLVAAQNPGRGWRYQARSGETDTSVTGWCFMALRVAQMAGLQVDRAVYPAVANYLADVTDSYAKTGYMSRDDAGVKVVVPGKNDDFIHHETMTAISVLCSLFPDTTARAANLEAQAKMLTTDLPLWDREHRTNDYYYWYYGTYALFTYDGPEGAYWKKWNDSLMQALVPNQLTRRDGCCEGSWDADDRWGFEGGRVYATALNTLTLEAYYRYVAIVGR